ncbi:NAD(P)-binding protein [Bimuria novae-zelandiae CBS 107.79]|uniref:NAD(P)-binding protein n=1 Tax=Bimuria novae-zelandiae CBS 107.79 TaxID=1447943 RepID=A0A6A5VU86_9PLEO|nr:NAD(P)-binding protein [Bimuria novae-zelandiae CBS 107.79]
MADKSIVLVTGGNTGIGYETVKALYASFDAHVVLMGSRSLDRAHAAIEKLQSEVSQSQSEVVPIQIDIEDDTSIEKLNQEIESKYGRLDILVNNAGGSYDAVMSEKPTVAGIREAFDHSYSLNVTSTHVLTSTLIPLILKSSQPRILFVTSGLSSLDNCSNARLPTLAAPIPKGWPKPPVLSQIAYRSSKTGLNMLMLEWQRFLKVDGVKVFCISPGFLATNLAGIGAEKLRQMGAGDPSLGGALIKHVVEGKRDADAGKVINAQGVQPW